MKKLLLIICIVCIGSAFYAQDRCERLGKDYTYLETLLGRTNDTTQMVKYLGMMEDLYYLNVQYDCGMPQTVLQSIVERKRSLLGVPKHVVVDKYVFAESYYEINYDDDALIIDLIAGKKRNKLEVLSVPDWLEEYNEDGDQGSLDFFVDENVSLDSRTGIVSVRDGNKVYDCQIVQLGSKFRCEMTKSITFGGTGGGNHVDIESNDTVYTYYCPLWLTLDKDKSGYVVRCSANPNLTARVDSIMFMFGCGQLQYVRVNQEAGGIRAEATKKEITFEAMEAKM